MECRAKGSTGDAITALMALAPRTALLLQGRREREVDAKLLLQGDLVKVPWDFLSGWVANPPLEYGFAAKKTVGLHGLTWLS